MLWLLLPRLPVWKYWWEDSDHELYPVGLANGVGNNNLLKNTGWAALLWRCRLASVSVHLSPPSSVFSRILPRLSALFLTLFPWGAPPYSIAGKSTMQRVIIPHCLVLRTLKSIVSYIVPCNFLSVVHIEGKTFLSSAWSEIGIKHIGSYSLSCHKGSDVSNFLRSHIFIRKTTFLFGILLSRSTEMAHCLKTRGKANMSHSANVSPIWSMNVFWSSMKTFLARLIPKKEFVTVVRPEISYYRECNPVSSFISCMSAPVVAVHHTMWWIASQWLRIIL